MNTAGAPDDIHDDQAAPPELDAEAAADSAAPAEVSVPAVDPEEAAKVPLEEMWGRMLVLIDFNERSFAEMAAKGVPHSKRVLVVDKAIANSISFLIDNEADIRDFVRQKRAAEARARSQHRRAQ